MAARRSRPAKRRATRSHWDQSTALQLTALAAARRAGDRLGEADTLAELGIVQRETGGYPAATTSLARALALYGDAGDLSGQANVLNQVGFLHVLTGGGLPGRSCRRGASEWRG